MKVSGHRVLVVRPRRVHVKLDDSSVTQHMLDGYSPLDTYVGNYSYVSAVMQHSVGTTSSDHMAHDIWHDAAYILFLSLVAS